jgi:hypothetical protein
MCWGTHHHRDHHTNARAVEQPARILIESFRHDDENNKKPLSAFTPFSLGKPFVGFPFII